MPSILTCACGARVRVPEMSVGASFRCPRCKAEIAVPSGVNVLSSSLAQPGALGTTCPICQSAIAAAEPVVTCPDCEQIHHDDCWKEVGGCSTYGCPKAPAVSKETTAQRPLTAWGDNKRCPACGEQIKSIALRCRYCNTNFETVDPLTAADLRTGVRKGDAVSSLQTTVIVLFILSLSGCLAPLSLLITPFVIFPKKDLLTKAGPFYQVLGYSALGLAVVYSLLMVLFFVFN